MCHSQQGRKKRKSLCPSSCHNSVNVPSLHVSVIQNSSGWGEYNLMNRHKFLHHLAQNVYITKQSSVLSCIVVTFVFKIAIAFIDFCMYICAWARLCYSLLLPTPHCFIGNFFICGEFKDQFTTTARNGYSYSEVHSTNDKKQKMLRI